MPVENIMYFALGLLIAGLVALMIMPAIWRRAVRLTKKRIEAATPMTMAEFRADKDQLRAEFALSTRRLEMNVEQLRRRLAEQVGDINRKKIDVAQLKTERDQHLLAVRELEEREGELRARLLELEKETTDLTQRLRMRDRDYSRKVTELEAAREALHGKLPKGQIFHAAGPVPGGWTIMAVHDSKASWEAFRDGILMPRMKAGIKGGFANPPQETAIDLYNVLS